MKTFIRKNFYHIALTAIFLVAFILRFYKLDAIPNMLQIDEASLGYNAWCLAHYGVDRYLNEMPFYAQNFDGGQSPLYTYSVALLIKTIGQGNLSIFLIRIPGFLSSMIVVILGTKLISLIFQNKKVTLMSALLLTICPYYVMLGRFALDCLLMLGCSTVSLYLLVKYIQTQRLYYLILCGISFGITLYSYALSYFLLPMFLILITLYMLYTGKITLRRSILWACCVCITGIPVILFACCLLFQLEPIHFLGFVISPIAAERMTDVGSENFISCIIAALKLTLTHGTRVYESVEKFNTMYTISIPFIIAGFFCSCKDLITSVKRRCFHYSSVFVLFFICGLLLLVLPAPIIFIRQIITLLLIYISW